MKTAARMYHLASVRPAEAVEDVLGLVAICVIVFVGFAATAIA